MCALGVLFDRFTANRVIYFRADAALSTAAAEVLPTKSEGRALVSSHLVLFEDATQQSDTEATFRRRDTTFFNHLVESRASPSPMDKLVWNSLDVFGSIEESVRAFCRVAATARTSHIACRSTHCMLDSRTAAQILHGIP